MWTISQQAQAAAPTEQETQDSRATRKKDATSRTKRGAGRTSGSGGTLDSASDPTAPVKQNGATTFGQALRRDFATAGITDSDV